jgi:hypothetical protein
MKKSVLAWCAVPFALTGIAFAAQRQHSDAKVVTEYSGELNSQTANRFLSLISKNTDHVIGLKLSVTPSSESDFAQSGYIAEVDGPQFVVSKTDPQKGGVEAVTNASVGRDAGMYKLDGFFIVKAGGMHQGVASFGLQQVDEATVRLTPSVRIVERPF